MKFKLSVSFFLIISFLSTYAQFGDVNYSWGGLQNDAPSRPISDVDGNIYLPFAFSGEMDVNPSEIEEFISSGAIVNAGIMKFNSNGEYQWSRYWYGTNAITIFSVILDSDGNLIVGGNFSGTVDFDPGLGVNEITSNGSNDIYFSKFSNNGDYLSTARIGGVNNDSCVQLIADGVGNFMVSGTFSSTVDFDPSSGVNNYTYPGAIGTRFIAKYTENFELVWLKNFQSSSVTTNDVVMDSTGNIYWVGFFTGTVDFNPDAGVLNLVAQSNTGNTSDGFIFKMNADGNVIWAKDFGSTDWDRAEAIVLLNDNEIEIAGNFDLTVQLGSTLVMNENSNGGAFIAKMETSTGSFMDFATFGGTVRDLSISENGDFWVAGNFDSIIDLDTSENSFFTEMPGFTDSYVISLNSDYTTSRINIFSGAENQIVRFLLNLNETNVYAFGQFYSTLTFANSEPTEELVSNGAQDMFMLQMVSCELPTMPSTISGLSEVCSGIESIYSVEEDNSVLNYFWSIEPILNSTFNQIASENNLTLSMLTGVGVNISVRSQNNCGISIPSPQFEVTRLSNPVLSYSTNLNSPVCENSQLVISISESGSDILSTSDNFEPGVPITMTSDETFEFSMTGENGCQSTVLLNYIVNPSPEIDFDILPSNTVCFGSEVTLSYLEVEGFSYASNFTNEASIVVEELTYFQLIGTDPNGCSSAAGEWVVVNPIALFDEQPSNAIVTEGDDFSFSVSSSSEGAIYQWQILTEAGWEVVLNIDGYSGANTTTLTYNGASLEMTGNIYRCRLILSSCDSYSEQVTLTVEANSSIFNLPNDESILIYPNPSIDEFQLVVPKKLMNSIMLITNYNGQVVSTYRINSPKSTINCRMLASGVYFISFENYTVNPMKFIKF